MDDLNTKDMKFLSARLYSLCYEIWKEEFLRVYGKNEAFTNWLNQKTKLNVNPKNNRKDALLQWIKVLEHTVV